MPDIHVTRHGPTSYRVELDGAPIGIVGRYSPGKWWSDQTPTLYDTRREAVLATVRAWEAKREREAPRV